MFASAGFKSLGLGHKLFRSRALGKILPGARQVRSFEGSSHMRLAEPFWLILLALISLPWLLTRLRPRVAWPTLDEFQKVAAARRSSERRFRSSCGGLRSASWRSLPSRPQTVGGRTRIAGEGVAIIVALDQSSSMSTIDFPDGSGQPGIERLAAAKALWPRSSQGDPTT